MQFRPPDHCSPQTMRNLPRAAGCFTNRRIIGNNYYPCGPGRVTFSLTLTVARYSDIRDHKSLTAADRIEIPPQFATGDIGIWVTVDASSGGHRVSHSLQKLRALIGRGSISKKDKAQVKNEKL